MYNYIGAYWENDMQINLSELFHVDGKEKNYKARIDMVSFMNGMDAYQIISADEFDIRIRNLGESKLLVEGKVDLVLAIPCGRCLDLVETPFSLTFEEEVDMKQSADERVENLDEQTYIIGYNLDVDQLVSNELLLNLPSKVLCVEDCKGICNRCGGNLNNTTCSCDQSSPDPRMSVIQDLFQQFKEV